MQETLAAKTSTKKEEEKSPLLETMHGDGIVFKQVETSVVHCSMKKNKEGLNPYFAFN